MSEYSEKFRLLIQMYREADIGSPNLKSITLAQWINESARGKSELAEKHNNFAGLKWRACMKNWAHSATYTDSIGETDQYCSFPSLAHFLFGYWVFLGRDVYEGWEVYREDPVEFMRYIGERFNPNLGYSDRVIDLLSEAKGLLDDEPIVAVDPSHLSSTRNVSSDRTGKYEIRYYRGDYGDRQAKANTDSCEAYVEHHFNSGRKENGYTVCIVATNASQKSKDWGRWYANTVAKEFKTSVSGDDGIVIGGFNGRGNNNLYYTNMPAILLEPLFASDPEQAKIIRSEEGQDRLARILADSIRHFFPEGGLIGFSVGHKYKSSSPNDRGTPVVGGGNEADFAEIVLKKTELILLS